MENFIEILAYAGIVLIYIISRLLQGKKQKTEDGPQPQSGDEPAGPKKPTPFEEFLQEIRGEEETQPSGQKPTSEEEPADHPFADKKRQQTVPEKEAEHDQPSEHPAPRAETEGRKPVKGTLEEKYGEEIKRSLGMESGDASGTYEYGTQREKGKKKYAKANYYRQMLKDKAGARKAIVLSEILKPKQF